MRYYLSVFVAVIFAIEAHGATGDKSPPSGVESIGGRLLDDLPTDAGSPPQAAQPRDKAKTAREIEDSLRASTPPHGFGAGASLPSQSLARVRDSMQRAQALLTNMGPSAQSTSTTLASPVQQEIVSDLDKLIAELSKQCQCCNGQCNQPTKPGQNPKPGKSGAAARNGRTAARDSTDRLDSSSAKPADKGDINEMAKALWGHLPVHSREQMLQSFSDEFLPKYELEIEEYYRRLSEEQGESQAK